ncbi:MAG: VWA-like domain-containing protein, partial [Clostridiales bacterium]|nr:VWA-like domain-containing protein [Clostridiales bacterium]
EKMEEKAQCSLARMKSAEYYYDKLSSLLDDSIALLQRESVVSMPTMNGSLMEAIVLNEETLSQVDASALKSKLGEIVDTAGQRHELPPELQTEFTISPTRAKIDWTNILKRFLSVRGRIEIRATYKRDSRRFDGFPGHKRSIGLKILVALDESGSISDEQLQLFHHELAAISRVIGAQILVTEFDTECSEPKRADVYRRQKNRSKKGGTDFKPIFKLAEALRIFFVVVFTDGDGDAPPKVNQRVLWVLTKQGRQPATYGYSVHFYE